MSFVQRNITLQFNSNGNIDTINLSGLRTQVIVTNPGGNNSYGALTLKVYGMTLDQMNTYSSAGADFVALSNQSITVSAGSEGAIPLQIFSGTLRRSYIDFSNIPDVAFVCEATSGLFQKVKPIDSLQSKGNANAEDLIKALAESNGFGFTNAVGDNAAHFVLQNQYAEGSAISQIETIAAAASFATAIENNRVYIWANGKNRDNVIIDLNQDTGMVGYPSYWAAGFVVKQEFNASVLTGRQIKLSSIIPKSNGLWNIISNSHELSTVTPDGSWFTTSQLATVGGLNVPQN